MPASKRTSKRRKQRSTDDLPVLARNIHIAIREGHFTRRSIAEELGVSYGAVHSWAAGRSEPSRDNLKNLAKLLGVAANRLRTQEIEPKKKLQDTLHKIKILKSRYDGRRKSWVIDVRIVVPDGSSSRKKRRKRSK